MLFVRGSMVPEGAGQIVMVNEFKQNTVFSGFIIRLRIKDENEVDPLFLTYLLRSPEYREIFIRIASGSVHTNITQEILGNIEVELPDITTQKKISVFLGNIDDKIELLQNINNSLECIAQSLFKSWFIDFEYPNEQGKPYKSSGGDMVDSEIGKIPKDWNVTRIEGVTDAIFSGGTPDTRKPEYWNGSIPWLSSGETGNRFVLETEIKITQLGVQNSSTRLARKGDVIVASAGQGSTRGQVSLLMSDVYINQSIVVLRASVSIMEPYYLFCNLASRYEELRRISDSHSSRGSLTTKIMANLKIVVPTAQIMIAIKPLYQSIWERIESNLLEKTVLSQIRDLLIPALLSGTIKQDFPISSEIDRI